MKSKILIIAVIFGLAFMSSCDKEEVLLFDDPVDGAATYLQFTNVEGVFQMVPGDPEFIYDLGVKILGEPTATDLTVNIETLASTTTGTAVVLGAASLVIPANGTFGSVEMTVTPDLFPLGDTVYLDLKASAAGYNVASYGGETHIGFIYNVCDYSMFDFLGAYICDEEGYGEYNCSFTPDASVENRIHNTNFWDWAAAGATVYYDLSGDLNQTIVIPDQPFEFGDGVIGGVVGTGTYDACTHTMVCDYDVEYAGDIYPTHHEFTPGSVKTTFPSGKPKFVK